MIRKWMLLLLVLVLTVVLPLGAVADKQHTFSVVPGDLLASEEGIAELLEVTAIRLTEGDRSGALTLILNDQPMVSLGLTADTTGLYAASEVLGDDVLYVTWDDAFAVVTDLLEAGMAEAGLDAAALQALETSMAEAKSALVASIGSGTAVSAPVAVAPASVEESLEMVNQLFPDDPEMAEYIKSIYRKMTIEDGDFAAEDRDTADQKYTMTMDAEDLLAVCDTNYTKNLLKEALIAENPDATAEELAQATEAVLAEVKAMYKDSGFELKMELYTLDAGQTLVGLDMNMNMSITGTDSNGQPLQSTTGMTAGYDRLTDAEGVSYKAGAEMDVDGQLVEFGFDLYRANSEKSEGMLGMLAGGEEIVVLYEAENIAADTRVRKADVYLRSGATTVLEPAASDRPVIGFVIKTEPAPEETLAKLENANESNSVDVLKLSDAEMQALGSTITTKGMQLIYTALGQLPTSTLNLLMSSGMAD